MAVSETHLYRHFNAEGDLLYVGISLSAINRLGQHADHSHWFKSIANVKIETFQSRDDALKAEREAIISEAPKHNIVHKKTAAALAAEAMKADLLAKKKDELLKRYVAFKPLYSMHELAEVLPLVCKTSAIKKLIESGQIGSVEIETPRGKAHKYVTGWQLIEYIESLQGEV